MNAADVELQKRNVTLGCQQVVYPMYSTEPICWNKSMLMPTIFTHHVNLERLPNLVWKTLRASQNIL